MQKFVPLAKCTLVAGTKMKFVSGYEVGTVHISQHNSSMISGKTVAKGLPDTKCAWNQIYPSFVRTTAVAHFCEAPDVPHGD